MAETTDKCHAPGMPRWPVLVVAFLAVGAPARRLRADDVPTGTILGRARAVRVPRPAPAQTITRQQNVCGRETVDQSVAIGPGGRLAGLVAWVEGLARPPGFVPSTVRLDQQGCNFVPHVMSATTGAALELTSHDAVLHTVHAVLGSQRTLFNVAIPFVGMTIRKRLLRPGRVRFRCDVGHTWMSAFLFVFDHPYHAVSGADGAFRIDAVPAGEHVLHVQHERLGERRIRVRVPPHGRVDVAAEL